MVANRKTQHSKSKRGYTRPHLQHLAPPTDEEGRILEHLLQEEKDNNPLIKEEIKVKRAREKITLPQVNLPDPEDL